MDLAAEWDSLPANGDRRKAAPVAASANLQIPSDVQMQRNQTQVGILSRELQSEKDPVNRAMIQAEISRFGGSQAFPAAGGDPIPPAKPIASTATQSQTVDYASQWDSLPVKADASKTNNSVNATTSTAALGSDTENFLAGAGKSVVDLGRGAKQLLDIPAKWLESKMPGISEWAQSKGMPSAAQSSAITDADVAESRALDKPLMDTKAGLAGNIGGTIASSLLPIAGAAKIGVPGAQALVNPQTYKAAATVGGMMGATQPTIEGESKALNTGVGALAGTVGNAVVNTIGRVAQPVKNVASAAYQKAVNVLENAGIPLDAAQKSGSALLGRLRSGFADNPFTAGAQQKLNDSQRAGFNRAVLNTIGEDATHATSTVMGAAENRINGVFKDILDRNNVAINDATVSRIGAVQSSALESEKKPVAAIANRIIDSVGKDGSIKGQVAYGIKKDLDRLAQSADSDLAYHARQLRSTLMDAVNDSLNEADKKAFATARLQFSNMKKIEPAIDKEGSGNISAPRLANVMGQKANRGVSIYGKGDQELVDLAYAGNMLLPDKFPNSGTASRMFGQAFWPVVGGMSGAHYGDTTGAGLGTALGLVGGRALPRVAQIAMQNPAMANYMSRGMQGPMVSIRDMLLLPETNNSVGGAVRRIPEAAASK